VKHAQPGRGATAATHRKDKFLTAPGVSIIQPALINRFGRFFQLPHRIAPTLPSAFC
jgi:hypothetical protein